MLMSKSKVSRLRWMAIALIGFACVSSAIAAFIELPIEAEGVYFMSGLFIFMALFCFYSQTN